MIDIYSNKTNRDESPETIKSRSQVKREMILLQKTGECLVGLSRDQIKAIKMPDNLKDAVLFAKNIKSHGARKRQLQFIGSLMRKVDVKPINDALYEIDRGRSIEISDFHRIETWRDDLVRGIDTPIEEIVERYPETDRQKLRNLTRIARGELNAGSPPKSSKELFKYIKKLAETESQ
jgi:ribosome-associated protein